MQHQAARAWLDQQLNGSTRVGLPRVSLLAFLRLVTNPRVFDRPEPMIHAWHQVRAWIACETAWIPQPTERYADLLNELLASALALEHGLTLCSTDGDFRAISGVALDEPARPVRATVRIPAKF